MSPNTSCTHAVQHTDQQGQCTLEQCISKSTNVVDYQGGKSTSVVDMGLAGTRHGQEEILHRRARYPIVSNKDNAHLRNECKSTRVIDRGLPGTRHGQEEILHRRARCPTVSWPWRWTWKEAAAHLPCLHRRGSEKLGPCWCMTHPAAAWQLPVYSSTSA